ncbi:hypothetical protein C1646_774734 [Rhizophagus diaphanus]|nr:hypothetical protein C1646_774734 [Rhizophagus diaphanus] [Rhizophagus sp. MUCL 43196]
MTSVIKSPLDGGFEGTYEEHVEYIDCFYARKASSHLIDGQKIYPFCGMAICYSCNKLIYLGIEYLSVGVRCIYNALEGIKNESSVQPGYICYEYDGLCYPVRNEWMFEKIVQLWERLSFVTYILVKRLLYYIDRKNNIVFFIRISEYKAYESKSSGLLKPICDSPLKYIYCNNGKDITVNFSDLDDNYANANLQLLKRDIGQAINTISGYEKTMWERIETKLEEVDVESLGFDHPICSGVLDIRSEPFTEMPSKINLDEDLHDVEFGKWLDSSKKLQEVTRRILESLYKVWKSPKYEAYIKKRKSINEGSYGHFAVERDETTKKNKK